MLSVLCPLTAPWFVIYTRHQYELTVINCSTWAVMETLTYKTAAVVANSTYSNVAINREVTLAFNSDSSRFPNTESYMHDAKWGNVYLYKNIGYALWGANDTTKAVRMGRNQAFINSVNVNSYTAWSAEVIDIEY